MTDRRLVPLGLAALLAAAPAAAQVRTAPVVVPVPGVQAPGFAAAGVAASLTPRTVAPTAPTLSLPVSVLPNPSAPLEVLGRAAAAEAAVRAQLPGAQAQAAAPASPAARAAAALSAPDADANPAKAPSRDERRAAVLEGLNQAAGWKAGAPTGPAVRQAERPHAAAVQAAERLGRMFDGQAGRSVAEPVRVEVSEVPALQAGPSGAALRDALREQVRRGYRSHDYNDAKSFLFTDADSVVEGGVRGVEDAYSGVFVPGRSGNGGDYSERGDQDGDGYEERNGMNVEHLWPQSYFAERLPMRSDLHHLMATFQHPNGMRGRLPFGEVPDNAVEYHNNAGARMGAGVFEPPDSAKGRVARAMLYFYTRYGDQNVLPGGVVQHFWNSRLETFLRWNRQFPPTAFEKHRNDVVEKYQGNRNPFVDDPSLADRVGVAGFRMDGGSGKAAFRAQQGSGGQVSGREAPPSGQGGRNKKRWDRRGNRSSRGRRW